MTESKPLFREPGEPLVMEAGPVQFVSNGVPMVAGRTDLSELADMSSAIADIVLGNCTTTIPLKLDFDSQKFLLLGVHPFFNKRET